MTEKIRRRMFDREGPTEKIRQRRSARKGSPEKRDATRKVV